MLRHRNEQRVPIEELSHKRVISVNIDDDLGEVTRVLAENHLKKAPVMEGNKMVGIINRSNITAYAIEHYLTSANRISSL